MVDIRVFWLTIFREADLTQQALKTPRASRTNTLVYCALFTTLIAAGAFIRIPVPVVPFTLQFLFTCLAGNLLGSKRGAISVLVYIALGLAGLPVFAEGGGIWYVAKPTFGYLLGFCAGTFVTGLMSERMQKLSMPGLLAANFAGLGIVYFFGMVWCYLLSNYVLGVSLGLWPLFLYCFLLAVPGDICLCIVAAFLTKRLRPLLRL